jgi:acetyl-CoA carboxylase biotin carboxyl carrier protein
MDIKKLKELIKLAKSEGIVDLKYKSGDDEISFKFPLNFEAAHSPILNLKPKENSQISDPPKSNLLEVKSPFVGTFYSSPSPETSPYVKKGDRVRKGQVLCIVEAMKIMNEIESEFSGEIVEICVENENYVEYGQVLFRIKP